MPDEFLSAEQQLTLMHIDLEIEEIVRDLDEAMEWEADDENRGLILQYLRWAYIQGYVQDRPEGAPTLEDIVRLRGMNQY